MKPFALLLLASALLIAGCATTAHHDYDRAAMEKFSAYQSFEISTAVTDKDDESVLLSPIVDRRIERAIQQNLIAKGFEMRAESPDFRVEFQTITKIRKELSEISTRFTRRHYYWGYRETYFIPEEYEEGTYIIDIIDAATNELVWRGNYKQPLGRQAPKESEVNQIVDNILAGFPTPN